MSVHTNPGIQQQHFSASSPTVDAGVRQWVVRWSMPIEAENAVDAAVQALEIHRDPASIATIFRVRGPDGVSLLIDVRSPDDPVVLERRPAGPHGDETDE